MKKSTPVRSAPFLFAGTAIVALAFLLAPQPAPADIVITGTPEFVQMVEDTLDKLSAAGGRSAEIISGLEASGHDHVITEASGTAGTGYEDTNDANSMEAGGTGAGTGSTTHWDPEFAPDTKGTEDEDGDGMPDPLPTNPCNVLIHELSHADDAANGTRDPRPDPESGVKSNEVKAVTDENHFRKADGQEPRNDYNCDPLPEDAVCPPGAEEPKEPKEPRRGLLTLRRGEPVELAPPLGFPSPSPSDPATTPNQPVQAIPLPQVTLSGVSLQSFYQAGDEVQIRLTLTNRGTTPVQVSGLLPGNFRVVSLTRDGIAVPTTSSAIDIYEGLDHLLENSLVSLPAGAKLNVPWFSNPDQALGGEALTTVALASDGNHMSMAFAVDAPGAYDLRVVYKYPGPVPPNSGVFTDRTNVARIQFSVQ